MIHYLKIVCCIFFFCSLTSICAQTTVGLKYNSTKAFNGYTLFAPMMSDDTYLIDNCGYVVNKWEGIGLPKLSVYLLEDGSLLRVGCQMIFKYSWEGDLLWSIDLTELDIYNHHDIEPLPNGNIIMIAIEDLEIIDAVEKGRDPLTIGNSVELDYIVEIEPIGINDANIVWEWHTLDHLIQDFNPDLENYGIIAEHPELIDINLNNDHNEFNDMKDWMHCNGLDYNTDLDQIIFSSRHFSEIFIIDHSTTTAQAAGKAGDLLWRWGKPENYDSGNNENRRLFGQHDPKWIPEGYPDAGKISIFNNGYERQYNYSSIHVIKPPLLADGTYEMEDNRFLPIDYHWTWQGAVFGDTLFSAFGAGVQAQANGNFLVCELNNRFFEVTRTGEVVWTYVNPVGEQIVEQNGTNESFIFRAERYATDYPAFINKDLTATTYIENENVVSDNCTITESEVDLNDHFIYPNPTNNFLNVISRWSDVELFIYNSVGQLVINTEDCKIDVNGLRAGVYVLSIKDNKTDKISLDKFIVQ